MKLIVGLGNPGKKYDKTRHNMGYLVLDEIADKLNIDIDKEAFNGKVGRGFYFGESIILFKPTTFMNLSGTAVKQIASYFQISTSDILVIYDDMAIPVGELRIREKGSSGAHKGIQNVIDNLGTEDIKRIRIGIGEPSTKEESIDYVLSRPSGDEMELIYPVIDKARDLAIRFIKEPFHVIVSTYSKED